MSRFLVNNFCTYCSNLERNSSEEMEAGIAEECLFGQNWPKISGRWTSGQLQG